MDNNLIVSVKDVSHRYSVQWAVRNLSFDVDRKGIVGLLGSNGAGKSTTMNIICGVLSQTSGDVWINGVNIRDKPVEAKRQLGFLPQKPPVYDDLTVDEYLRFAAHIRHMPPRQINQAVERVKQKLSIAHFGSRLIRNLSGGYQQRVGLAQAIIHDPKLVVLDEPTNGLDPNQILEIRHLIREIGKERCVFLSTHILTEVQATCDRIMMIESGSLIFSGSLEEFENYIEPNSLRVVFETIPRAADLESVKGVVRVENIDNHPSQFRIWFDGDRDISKRIMQESMARGWILTEIIFEKSSADEIFAKLSKKAARRRS